MAAKIYKGPLKDLLKHKRGGLRFNDGSAIIGEFVTRGNQDVCLLAKNNAIFWIDKSHIEVGYVLLPGSGPCPACKEYQGMVRNAQTGNWYQCKKCVGGLL